MPLRRVSQNCLTRFSSVAATSFLTSVVFARSKAIRLTINVKGMLRARNDKKTEIESERETENIRRN